MDGEESVLHQEHEELDDLLISTLEGKLRDSDPGVRSEVVKGLSTLELEQHSSLHEYHELDDFLFEHDV